MNETTVLISAGRAARQLGLTVPRFEAIAEQMGIRPALRLDDCNRYRDCDVLRIQRHLASDTGEARE